MEDLVRDLSEPLVDEQVQQLELRHVCTGSASGHAQRLSERAVAPQSHMTVSRLCLSYRCIYVCTPVTQTFITFTSSALISRLRLWDRKRSCFHGSSRHLRNKQQH